MTETQGIIEERIKTECVCIRGGKGGWAEGYSVERNICGKQLKEDNAMGDSKKT